MEGLRGPAGAAARAGDPARLAGASRSLRALASGTRPGMAAELARVATATRSPVTAEDGISRVWFRRRGTYLPAAELFYVAAPGDAQDKEGAGFTTSWRSPQVMSGDLGGNGAVQDRIAPSLPRVRRGTCW
jgi:hypothetical protein